MASVRQMRREAAGEVQGGAPRSWITTFDDLQNVQKNKKITRARRSSSVRDNRGGDWHVNLNTFGDRYNIRGFQP